MTRFRVRYAETDQMGVVYHANYLIWLEMGRTDLCRELGVRYADMETQEGVLLVVAEANCRFHAPARYDDEIEVITTLGAANARMVRFDYEVLHAESRRKLASGYTKHIFCDRGLLPTRLPRKYRPLFGISERNQSLPDS